jgi:hypothetical protein
MKNTNDHPFAGYKLSQINIKSRQIMENKQEPKISTGLAVHTNLVAGEYPPIKFSTEYNGTSAKVLSNLDLDTLEKLLENLRTADA